MSSNEWASVRRASVLVSAAQTGGLSSNERAVLRSCIGAHRCS
ncbi:hypothetical protein A7982_12328 [Minicystis rosea]|nr:hypothetical protein A7982_12328 [Minicystis rosea]